MSYFKGDKRESGWIGISNLTVEMAHDITSIYDGGGNESRYKIWTLVNNFKLFVCGDLEFFTTISWRENHSSCDCSY